MQELSDIINQMDIKDIYRTFQPNTKEYTFFSAPHGTFSKTDHMLVTKFKKAEMTPHTLLGHYELKLDINNNGKLTNSWKLNKTLLDEKNGSRQKLRKN